MRAVAQVLGPSGGGIRRHVRYLAMHPPDGWMTVRVLGPESLAPYFDGLPFEPLGPRALREAGRADLVHTHGLRVGAYGLVPRRMRRPEVLSIHMDLPLQGRTASSPFLLRAAPAFVRRADAVIAVSARIASMFPGARYIPPAVDPPPPATRPPDVVRNELGAGPDDVVVLALARLHPDKALDVLVDGVRGTGAVCWIAGEGTDRPRLETMARGTGVRFLGFRTDVADLLAAADALAMTSVGEGYPIAVVEAITAGTPVLATRAGAIEEIVGDAGIVTDAGDRAGFRDAVERFLTDAELRGRLTAAARERRLPGPHELVARIGEVYESAMGDR